ncbi:MAG: hypothetical protein WD766_10885 [Gemmatimonadota bacterium]
MLSVDPGICSSCLHARVLESRRGSSFLLCELSAVDDRFPRYPPLPVLSCAGWEWREISGSGGSAPAPGS